MLVKDLYKQLEFHISEENKELMKGYFDLLKQHLAKNKLNLASRNLSLKDLNEHFNGKFEAGYHLDTVFIKNGTFNIAFLPKDQFDRVPHFLIEDVKNGNTYRTVVTDNFTKTSSISNDGRFKEQIAFSNIDRENSNRENLNKSINLNVGDFVIDLIHSKDKNYTNKEICDLVEINIPESNASSELVAMFVEHQAKLKDVINNKVENKVQQKPTL